MRFADLFNYVLWASLIEFVGALLIVGYILVALYIVLRGGNIVRARMIVADGAITGLSFKVAGTLLKTITIHTWQQILMFLAIFALRTVLKRFFMWEKGRLQ